MRINNKRILLGTICIIFLMPLSSVYAVDLLGTYTGSLQSEGGTPISITVESNTVDYIDYRSYEVNLNKDQEVNALLEVPNGADFDLFFCTTNMSVFWYNVTNVEGQDESQLITVPESGNYLFIVADYSGSGTYTLRWTSTNAGVDSTMIFSIIAIVVIVIIVVIAILLLMRRRKRIPPHTPSTPGTVPPPPSTA